MKGAIDLDPWCATDLTRALAVIASARAAGVLTPAECETVLWLGPQPSLGTTDAYNATLIAERILGRAPSLAEAVRPTPRHPVEPLPDRKVDKHVAPVDPAAIAEERRVLLAAVAEMENALALAEAHATAVETFRRANKDARR
jgi:hypothetical protein